MWLNEIHKVTRRGRAGEPSERCEITNTNVQSRCCCASLFSSSSSLRCLRWKCFFFGFMFILFNGSLWMACIWRCWCCCFSFVRAIKWVFLKSSFRFSRGSSTENNKKKIHNNTFFPSLRFIKSSLFSWHVRWSSLKMSPTNFIFSLWRVLFFLEKKKRRGMRLMERQLIKNQLIRKIFAWMLAAIDNKNFHWKHLFEVSRGSFYQFFSVVAGGRFHEPSSTNSSAA